jgi:DNA invertase Pin-like site-specific DNA recombinase
MSKDRQEDSPERQRGTVLPHCEAWGYEVAGEYLDPGITGDEFVKRAAFQRLLADARPGPIDGIVVDHKDRLSWQHPIDYIADVVRPLRDAGVCVEAVKSGRLDWDTMAGLLTDHIYQHQAAEESPKIAYHTLTEMFAKAGRGRRPALRPRRRRRGTGHPRRLARRPLHRRGMQAARPAADTGAGCLPRPAPPGRRRGDGD